MTHRTLETYPFVTRDRRTAMHWVLAAFVGVATLAYAALAAYCAIATYVEITTAAPSDDIGLAGLGYLLAGFAGIVALVCASVGAVGWKVSRRSPDLGAVVLLAAALLGLLPLTTWVV